MSGFKKKITDAGVKAAGRAAKTSAKAMGAATKRGAKIAAEKASDSESRAEWLVNVLTRIPEYLRLYFSLLTDNRVSGKVKVLLVTAVAALGANYAFGGALLSIQTFLAGVLGPLAFLPTILILLLTLDFCYTLIDAEVFEGYEKEIFGDGESLESDIHRLRDFMGVSYDKFKKWWQKKADRVETQMQKDGLIIDGELTDEVIQDVSDQIVELEISDDLRKEVDKHIKLLGKDEAARDAIKALEHRFKED